MMTAGKVRNIALTVAHALGHASPTFSLPTVDTVDLMTDTTARYVLASTDTVWAYGETEVDDTDRNMFDINEVVLNALPDGSSTTGRFSTGFIPTDISTTEALKYTITIKGSMAQIASTSAGRAGAYQIHFYNKDYASISGDIAVSTMKRTQDNDALTINIGTNSDGTAYHGNLGSNYLKIAYIKVVFYIKAATLTAADVPTDLVIMTCEPKRGTGFAWYDTGLSPEASGGGNYVDLLVKVNKNAGELEAVNNRVQTLETESGTYTVPAYWNNPSDSVRPSYLSGRIAEIKALQDAGGNDVVNFMWFSDVHYGGDKSYTGNIGVLCHAVMKECHIPIALMNGDTLTAGANNLATEDALLSVLENAWDIYAPIGADRLMLVSGNHEDAYGQYTDGTTTTHYVNKADPVKVWNRLYRPQAKDFRRVFGGDGTYFYLDHMPQKVRFVCLNSSFYDGEAITNGNERAMSIGFGADQLAWLRDVALAVEDGWSVVIALHVPPISDYASVFSGTDYTDFRSIITNSTTDIIALFCGHMHRDAIYTDNLPCPICVVTCAVNTPYDGTADERVAGTTYETALDVVSINKATRSIHMTRIGHGADRTVSF